MDPCLVSGGQRLTGGAHGVSGPLLGSVSCSEEGGAGQTVPKMPSPLKTVWLGASLLCVQGARELSGDRTYSWRTFSFSSPQEGSGRTVAGTGFQ